MAKKATRRLYALGESIVLTEGEKIIKCYNFEQEELYEALNCALNEKGIHQPVLFFKNAIENMTGLEVSIVNVRIASVDMGNNK